MKLHHFCFLIFFTLLFLFYPGDTYYARLFTRERQLFEKQDVSITYDRKPFPFMINPYLAPDITAEGAYIVDLDSFTPIFQKNANDRFLPASTTKVITALVSSDIYSFDTPLTVKRTVTEGQKMGLFEGEKMSAENLLYGLLIHSGNDAAYVFADNYSGGFDDFIVRMNQKAVELGMKNSRFKNPAGFDDQEQYTSPFDLAIASRVLLSQSSLAKMVSTKSITVSDVDFTNFHALYNVNKLLGEIPGIAGVKTGYTEEAGEHLISLYKKPGDDKRSLIVILKSADRFEDTKNIVNWLTSNISYQSF
ncbi:MAG TPA: serine hydrolase [Patescibacteria group bacterium]|nr:serine hydrolase [Patescibacteria group bacterium]